MDTKREETSAFALIAAMANNTGMHGLPNVGRSQHIVRKVFWMLIFLAGAGMLIWQVYEALAQYYSYPTKTSIIPKVYNKLNLPAVTICNVNPVRKSLLYQLDALTDPSNRTYENFETAMNALNVTEKQKIGHQLKDMMLYCNYNGYSCDVGNFTTFYNSYLGNCFTFNGGNRPTVDGLGKTGPYYGLDIEFYIEQDEYEPEYSEYAGMKVVIHNPKEMSFPEDQGLFVSPGAKSLVSLKKIENTRADPPHGECRTFNDEETKARNAYKDSYDYLEYTSKACGKTCYQQYVMSKCGCHDTSYPSTGSAFENITSGKTYSSCKSLNSTYTDCNTAVYYNYTDNIISCANMCPPACTEVLYDMTTSNLAWPSVSAFGEIVKKLEDKSTALNTTIQNMTEIEKESFVRKNVVSISVFYGSLEVTKIKTEPSFRLVDLLFAIGGSVGLWLGLSVISVIEIVELLYDISSILVCCCFKTKPNGNNAKTIQVDPQS